VHAILLASPDLQIFVLPSSVQMTKCRPTLFKMVRRCLLDGEITLGSLKSTAMSHFERIFSWPNRPCQIKTAT